MTSFELKQILISHIRAIDDEIILNKIKDIILKYPSKDFVYILNHFEKDLIKQGEEDIKNGRVTEKDVFFKEVDQWLSAR